MSRIICITGGKGGVGKTTTAINLAAGLNYFDKSVTLVDTNLTTPNVGLHLGVPIVPVTLHDVLKGKNDISDAIYMHHSGLRVVPASIALSDLKNLEVNKLSEVISSLDGSTDFIIVDGAAGLGREALSGMKASDEVIIVTNPEMPAVTDALKTIKLCQEIGRTVLGVVVTKTNSRNKDMSIGDIEAILEKPVMGIIPEDRAVKFALSERDAVVHCYPSCAASVQYKKLCASLIGEEDYHEKISGEPSGFTKLIMKIFNLR